MTTTKKLHALRLLALSICTTVCLEQRFLAASQLISVDLQSSYGDQGRDFSGVDPEAAAASPLFSTANIWNHIGTTGYHVLTDVSGLVDSDGNPTGVGFKTSAHGAYGKADFGPSDLLNDYFWWKAPENPLQWELNGLEPGSTYALFLNGSQSDAPAPRRFLMTVDTYGDGSLTDATAVEVVSPPGAFLAFVVASPDGKILGMGSVIQTADNNEADWGGFQLAGPMPCAAIAASVSGDNLICPGQLATLSVTVTGGTAPYRVRLNNGDIKTGDSPLLFSVSPTSTTTYQILSVRDANGCSASTSGSATVTLDVEPPTVHCQSAQVVLDAQGHGTLTASAVDGGTTSNCGIQSLSVSPNSLTCANLGLNLVTLTALSYNGSSASCQTTVTVVDNTPPTIGSCPGSKVVDATIPAGAVVTFPAPSASDNCSVSVTCQPASASTFPIGTTLVTCTATDGANAAVSCTFTITVRGAAEQIRNLIEVVNALPKVTVTVKTALVSKLGSVLQAYNANNAPAACTALQDFINLVNAQVGKKQISTSLANDLLTAARRIGSAMGCH